MTTTPAIGDDLIKDSRRLEMSAHSLRSATTRRSRNGRATRYFVLTAQLTVQANVVAHQTPDTPLDITASRAQK
jgi:hypothetical protein